MPARNALRTAVFPPCRVSAVHSSGGFCANLLAPGTALGQTDRVIIYIDMDDRVLRRIADDAERISTSLNDLDLLPQHAPKHYDAAVAMAEMLFGPVDDVTLALPRHRILG